MRTTGANGRQSSLSPVFLAAAGSLAHVNANGPLSAAPPPPAAVRITTPRGKRDFSSARCEGLQRQVTPLRFLSLHPPPPGGGSIGARSEKRSQLKAWAEATARSTHTTGAKRSPHPPRASTLPGRGLPPPCTPFAVRRPATHHQASRPANSGARARKGTTFVELDRHVRPLHIRPPGRGRRREPGPVRTPSRRRQLYQPDPAHEQPRPRRPTR